jgi:hypothetical protein
MASLFFSYSHKDEAVRDELEIHLAMLKRQGVIEAWHDRRVLGGDEWDQVIKESLETADIILMLVSPYFLASKYCYDIEVRRALERHEAGSARVIPVIVDPCDWLHAPFAKLATLPTDGKPISKYPNRHDAFLEVTQAIRAVASVRPPKAVSATLPPIAASVPTRVAPDTRSSNLRLKKQFTDQNRDEFLDESFEYVAKFFEGSLSELQNRNPGITGRFRRVTSDRFTAEIYRQGTSVGACGIRLGSFASRYRQILFSHDPSSTNGHNEAIGVGDDGYTLFLTAVVYSGQGKGQLSREGAAEILWGLLIAPLQR